MQQITRGDYLKDLITIYIENNLQTDITELYSQFIFQCGEIQKAFTPAQVIKISFSEQESLKLKNLNTCYLAGITVEGHKETFNGSLTFNTRGEVVNYEPAASGSVTVSGTTANDCGCQGLRGVYSNCCQPAIKAYFSINYVPTKLSELQNDTDFQDSVDVANSIAEHNASESAHPYIQSVMASTTEALSVSIQAETTARIDAVSLAISTTEAYTDSVVTQATEATKAYADSIVSTATTATEAYTDSLVQSATTAINTTIGDLSQLDTSVKSSVTNAINAEVSARQGADNNLQGQIDALAAASDVTDIVGTYAELQSYDTQHLNNNDIIKVLSDETHDDEPSYYRFNKTADTFSYIGSESAAYTKAQSNSIFVAQTTTVNGKALSSDISLTYSDVSALPATTQTVIDAHTSAIAANTSAIAANTTAIASNTTAIATNTSAISTINGKIPTDASSSNKLVSASALAASIADFANKDLNNLSTVGTQKLRSLNSYANEGELLTDPDGLAFVEKYAHSTFDLSKFTVVGSPNITDDGIASGFRVGSISPNITLDGSKETIIKINATANDNFVNGVSYSQILLQFIRSTNWNLDLNAQRIRFNFAGQQLLPVNTILVNDILDVTLYIKNDTVKMTLIVNGINTYSNQITLSEPIGDFGVKFPQISEYKWNGSIDLKQFSITVDRVEVFSGNKTGIDTIKPDDYTVVGSPTISADGVVTNFPYNAYVTKSSLNIPIASKIEIFGEFTYKTGVDNIAQALSRFPESARGLQVYNGKFNWGGSGYLGTTTFVDGNSYDYKIVIENSSAKVYLWNNGAWVLDLTETTYIPTSNFDTIDIGGNRQYLTEENNRRWLGSIDLNAFKVYVDGNLVYQPCLKIPYTESKTGSKIVDSIYRDRVNDVAEQFGFANYYTLSDTDFTLPQVELYGLIGQRTLRDSYRNGINYWELYSNRDLEQGGSCTSGVEVTFARPFADTNYVLSVPYSAKSATAFTPTQTGDWIAKGKGVL